MGIFEMQNQRTFKWLVLVVMIIVITGLIVLTFGGQAQSVVSRTVLFEDNTYIFETDVNFNQDIDIIGAITGSSLLRIQEGISIVDSDFNSLFDIFVADFPNGIQKSSIPETSDNALVIQRTGLQNDFFIGVIFWDQDSNRPNFVLNAGTPGRASTFDRSLQIGKDKALDIIDTSYTICEGTTLADCDTALTGADLVVEDDIENFGSLQVHENAIIDGNLSFAGAFGELFDVNNGVTITIITKDVFVPVKGIQTGNSRNTLVNDTNVTVQIEGFYLVNYSFSFTNANNLEYNTAIMVNGIVQDNGQAQRKLQANDVGNMGGTAIIDLDVGDNVSMAIANLTNVADPIITSTTLTVTYIGN